MLGLVKGMGFANCIKYTYKGEVHETIDYRLIDFGDSKHAETYLELDFVWGEISCA